MIVVMGATGNIGRPLVEMLVASGQDVRGITRDPDRAGLPAAAEAVSGDPERPESLRTAFLGAQSLFLLPTGSTELGAVLSHAGAAGVDRVVLVSSLLAQTHPESFIGRASLGNEQLVRDSGLAWTMLRPWEFASNALSWAESVRSAGEVRLPTTGVPSPAVDPADIAAVAAHALVEDGHHGQVYPLTGPHELTVHEKVRALGLATGRDLSVRLSPDAPRPDGAPDEATAALLVPGVCGLDSPGVLATTERVTGAPARSFQQWALRHAETFQ